MAMSRLHLVVRGNVQGVGYRWAASRRAHSLGLVGWIENCLDGSVEILVEGDQAALDSFLAWSKEGPSYSQVDMVEESWGPATGDFWEFTIRR
jgi:acylphosphatase